MAPYSNTAQTTLVATPTAIATNLDLAVTTLTLDTTHQDNFTNILWAAFTPVG
jgi:hypothetical protein